MISREKVIERSVDSLQKIYAVVIALAISEAIHGLLIGVPGHTIAALPDVTSVLPGFLAFLVTLVPFYHGMSRHLDHCYLEKPEAEVKLGALIFDFAVFFVEASFLFGAAWLLRSGLWSFFCLGALLLVDMLWGGISHLIHYWGQKPSIVRWSAINLVAGSLALLACLYPVSGIAVVLMLIALGRSIFDYVLCWKFYFPSVNTGRARR